VVVVFVFVVGDGYLVLVVFVSIAVVLVAVFFFESDNGFAPDCYLVAAEDSDDMIHATMCCARETALTVRVSISVVVPPIHSLFLFLLSHEIWPSNTECHVLFRKSTSAEESPPTLAESPPFRKVLRPPTTGQPYIFFWFVLLLRGGLFCCYGVVCFVVTRWFVLMLRRGLFCCYAVVCFVVTGRVVLLLRFVSRRCADHRSRSCFTRPGQGAGQIETDEVRCVRGTLECHLDLRRRSESALRIVCRFLLAERLEGNVVDFYFKQKKTPKTTFLF